MRFLRYLVLFCIAVIGGTVSAQSQRELGQLMRNRGEYYFTLIVDNPKEILAISEICSVDGTDGRRVVAYANQKEYDRLLQAGFQPELQTPPSLRANVTMWNGQGTYNWDSYLTYPQYVSMMESFPSMAISGRTCSLFSLGTLSTSNHRQLLGVRINNGSPEGKPKFLYTSTMHGDEITGMILMLRLINELCTSTDSQIVELVNNLDIYIMPLTNPDGTYNGGNNTVNNAKRYNGHNIDLNRNYKDYYKGAHPDGNSYEDETIWTMAMGDENLFTMSANYHGGAEVMNYPWDAVYDDHADKNWYEYVCSQYVQIARQTYSSYMSDTYSDGVTNGAEWYIITGSRQDYMNAYAQCREVTVECSTTKTPNASSLPSFWNYNRNSMLAFMEQCLKGVHGFVYDANTDQPIEGVKVTVLDHDSQTSFVTTHAAGDFHRPIKGGSYTFEFTKDGYCPYYVDVTVADGQRVELNNIQLTPGNCMVPSFIASTTEVSLGQSISFTDNSFGTIASWNWTFEGATPSTSTAQNPTNITYSTAGDYDVTLTITDAEGNSETLTKEDYIHVAESITMQNGTVTTCSGIFYDSGGPDSNYGNNLTYTMTFYPGTEGAMVSVNFTQFNTESGYDYLYIYNGTSTSATLIGQYDGTSSPGTVMATNEAGALTFKFTSDSGVNAAGWIASVSCFYTDQPVNISVTANPSNGGTVSGGGEFTFGETCTVIATPRNGYTFTGWTENEEVVSNELEYSFTAINDRELVANFIHMTVVEIGESETTNNYLPSYSYYKQALTQQIYTAEEIGTAGTITSIAFYNEGTTRTRTYDFYLKTTEKSSFNSNTDWIAMAATDKVFSGSVTMTAGTWTTIFFDTPFEYDGTSNLVLVADDNTGRYDSSPFMSCSVFSTNTNQAIYYWDDDINFDPMSPPTTAGSSSWGGSHNDILSVKNHIRLGIEVETEEEQAITFAQGSNWWSTNLDITLDQLKDAIVDAVGSTGTATIKSQNSSISLTNGYWRPANMDFDIREMYQIQVSTDCEITLSGMPVDPADYPITIHNGINWIGFLTSESMTIEEAFAGLNPAIGDVIKSKNGSSSYNGTIWRGSVLTLEPGQGYIYQSTASDDKTFTFGTNNNK
jgi:PKD repeat protein